MVDAKRLVCDWQAIIPVERIAPKAAGNGKIAWQNAVHVSNYKALIDSHGPGEGLSNST